MAYDPYYAGAFPAATRRLIYQRHGLRGNAQTLAGEAQMLFRRGFHAHAARREPRRAGDVATCYSDPSKAAELLGWKAEKNIEDMCRDSWRWQSQNPKGYDE